MRATLIILTAVAAVACSDAFNPTTENVAGNYTVRTFTTTDTSGTINWIQRGGRLTIGLNPLGLTAGRLFVPGGAEGGADLDELLIGHWTLSGNTVTFDMPAVDTFVRDMPWTVSKNQLSGEHTFGGTTVKVVLTK